jgi:hypothetical protein
MFPLTSQINQNQRLMVEPSILYRLQEDQQMLKEIVDFLFINTSKYYPGMMRHIVAILKGS